MITVTNCGHDSRHQKPCNIEHPRGLSDYLLLLIKSEAFIYFDGIKKNVPIGSIIIFPPGTYIHYGCDVKGYNDDWIHFELKQSDKNILKELSLPVYQLLGAGEFHRILDCVRLICDCYHKNSDNSDMILDHYMHALLYTLSDEATVRTRQGDFSELYSILSGIRSRIYSTPSYKWSVEDLAKDAGLSLSYFQHMYKKAFGLSASKDIINARLELAKYYLSTSNMSIHALSDFCGYENELHFMRQFKSYLGVTPSQYRKGL
ncbi:MAG: helix-turn-helix transcriptional regulator [Butyrivibrio sp.]|nr:helix-turn-helix transcriptional regulator [Butyrivibrio sp.]